MTNDAVRRKSTKRTAYNGATVSDSSSLRNPGTAAVQREPDALTRTTETARPSVSIGSLSVQTRKQSIVETLTGPKLRTIKSEKHIPLPWAVFLITVICAVLFVYMVQNIVQISEYTSTVNSYRVTMNKLAEEEKKLELQLERKNDLRVIEKIATEELGMVKRDQVLKRYVTVKSGEKIEVTEEAPTEYKGIMSMIMSAFGGKFNSDEYPD